MTKPGTPYHSGTYAECPVVGRHQGTAWLWCYAYNDQGKLWYAVRDADTSTAYLGWVWSGNVTKVSSQHLGRC